MAKRKHLPQRWTPFHRCDLEGFLDELGRRTGRVPVGEADVPIAIYQNARYEVHVHRFTKMPIGMTVIQLSIKRRDKREIHDWRDLQRIKNEIVGPEIEAIEIYPAESRLVDTANQYHLWCFPEGHQVPVGYCDGRVVMAADSNAKTSMGSRQRPFEDGTPEGSITVAEAERRIREGK